MQEAPQQLPSFSLEGTDKQHHTIPASPNRKGTVIIFTCNHCPYARAYAHRIADLVEEYTPKGIDFFAINPNDADQYPQDSLEKMPELAQEMALNGHYLRDPDQTIATRFQAERTPEVFLYNSHDQLLYHGAIDDNWQDPRAVTSRYLRDAIDQLLNGADVQVSKTKPVGCTIKWSH